MIYLRAWVQISHGLIFKGSDYRTMPTGIGIFLLVFSRKGFCILKVREFKEAIPKNRDGVVDRTL